MATGSASEARAAGGRHPTTTVSQASIALRMDEVEQLIEAYMARTGPSAVSRLDALMNIEVARGPRIVRFLLDVLTDEREPVEVRLRALKRLRDATPADGLREVTANTIVHLVQIGCSHQLRLHGALALAEFVDTDGVPLGLAAVALNPDLPLDLRYSAFTSLERAGPSSECVALLRQLVADEALGAAARSHLSWWHIEDSH
jgi:hypothetical protein